MSRLDRLELIVRHLADRILGEEITFDEIAEKEAEEQGKTYVPPAAVDISPLIEELARTADARHIEQERALQALAQALNDLNHRVSEIEAGLRDQLTAAQRRLSA